jgi:hypothetical protein
MFKHYFLSETSQKAIGFHWKKNSFSFLQDCTIQISMDYSGNSLIAHIAVFKYKKTSPGSGARILTKKM